LLVAGTALAPSGHASAAAPQRLARPMVFLHTTTIAVWIGERPLAALDGRFQRNPLLRLG